MDPTETYTAFRRFLRERNLFLKNLNPPDGLVLMPEFYKVVRVDTVGSDGDGLAYCCSIPHRRSGARFEFSLFRVFRAPTPGAGYRLRLSFAFSWLDAVKWLGRPDFGLPQSAGFAWNEESIPQFVTRVEADPVYLAIRDKAPKAVELRLEPKWDIFG